MGVTGVKQGDYCSARLLNLEDTSFFYEGILKGCQDRSFNPIVWGELKGGFSSLREYIYVIF
jgi:hypothetical protein